MRRLLCFLFSGCLALLLAGCSGGGGGEVGGTTWDFLVYMDGDNNLQPYMLDSLNQLERAGSTDQVNILVLFDGKTGAYANGTILYRVTKDTGSSITSTVLQNLPEQDMSNPATLRDFIIYCQTNYPSDRTVLTLKDHGGGVWPKSAGQTPSPRGICWDDTTTGTDPWNCLTTDEVASALTQARAATGRKVDLIQMDACLMQTLEVAYEWRGQADCLVGSEEISWTDGFDYEQIVRHLLDNPGLSVKDYAVALVDDYYQTNLDHGRDTSFSALDLGQPLQDLFSAFQVFAADLAGTGDTESVVSAWAGVVSFNYFELKDLAEFVSMVRTSTSDITLRDSADAIAAAIPDVVIHHHETGGLADHAAGISITLPGNGEWWYYYAGATQYVTLALANDSQWDEFLTAFRNYAPDTCVSISWTSGNCDLGIVEPGSGTTYWSGDTAVPLYGILTPDRTYGGSECWALDRSSHALGSYDAYVWSEDYFGKVKAYITRDGITTESEITVSPGQSYLIKSLSIGE